MAKHAAYGARLEALAARTSEAEAAGRSIPCTNQLFLEAKWLHRATAHWQKLEDKYVRVELSFSIDNQDFVLEQSPVDGLLSRCHEEHSCVS